MAHTRIFRILPLLALLGCVPAVAQESADAAAVRGVIEQFEKGLQARDLKQIEAVVAPELVAIENGHRNDGWADFRDHHLVPEIREPAPPSTGKIVKISASPGMAWGYSRTEMQIKRKSGEPAKIELWSVYVLERRDGAWKIVLLDWSIRTMKAS